MKLSGLRCGQRVRLASHVRALPACDGRPAVGHDTELVVLRTCRARVSVGLPEAGPDGVAHTWYLDPSDLEPQGDNQ